MRGREFIHPLDVEMSQKIEHAESVRKMLDDMDDEELDGICAYVYSSSLPEVRDDNLLEMAHEAFKKFEVPSAKLYMKRSYEFDVEVVGYRKPILILPGALLDRGDREIIQSRLFAAAGAIAANHHRTEFLLKVSENFNGLGKFPLLGATIKGFFNEWGRARTYTRDRAVLQATGDMPLTLKNILYGVVPFDVLERFNFGSVDDSFREQTERYLKNDNPAQMLGKAFGFFADYAWLPRRYEEVIRFRKRGGSDDATAL